MSECAWCAHELHSNAESTSGEFVFCCSTSGQAHPIGIECDGDEAGSGVGSVLLEPVSDSGAFLGAFGQDKHVAAPAGTEQFQGIHIRRDQVDDRLDFRWVGPGVQCLIQPPASPDRLGQRFPLILLDGSGGKESVETNLLEDPKSLAAVEKHPSHDLLKDVFGDSCDPCVVEHDTIRAPLGLESMCWQPLNVRGLIEPGLGAQELDPGKECPCLILPAASGCEELFQGKGPEDEVSCIPLQVAEIVEGTQQGACQNTAGAQTGSLGNGCKEADFESATEIDQLFT